MVLKDRYGRPLLNLRVAITRKCNLNCFYCHREGEENSPSFDQEMTIDEIVRMTRIAVSLGISRVKLTGGEPLMRGDATEIIKGINDIAGVTDLSITTNGTLLAPVAKKLRMNGLNRINISLPVLDREVYHKLTGGKLEAALEGVEAAVDAGLSPVKLNMILLKGVNDNAVPEMIDFAAKTGSILQLIELEPVNLNRIYYEEMHKPMDEYEGFLQQKAVKVETRPYMQNRRIYDLLGVKVETIRPIENTEFCRKCTRMRVTSDGKLKPCLMNNDYNVDILSAMRNGAREKELTGLFMLANNRRQPYNTNVKDP